MRRLALVTIIFLPITFVAGGDYYRAALLLRQLLM